jgi:predicted permease
MKRRRSLEDLDQDIRDHIDRETQENIERGMSLRDARHAARRQFGSVAMVKEDARAVWTPVWFEQVVQDARHAIRTLRRNPGFSSITIVTLAVGIGATTAIFSLVDAVWIRSLPYADTAHLAYVGAWNPKLADIGRAAREGFAAGALPPSTPDFLDLRQATRSFSALALMSHRPVTLETRDVPIRVTGTWVSSDFFRTLGVNPQIGRALEERDEHERGRPVAVIGHALWQSQFSGDVHIVGRTLHLNGEAYDVVGVMPRAFSYPGIADLGADASGPTDVWMPMIVTPAQLAQRDLPDSDAAIGRLRAGVTVRQAQTEFNTLFGRLNQRHSPEWRGWYPIVSSFDDAALGRTRPLGWLLLCSVALVLLVACGNAAHLLLARAASRTHEMGIRVALGAGSYRLMRHVLTEALVLALGGGILGLGIAYWAVRLLPLVDPGTIPRLNQASIDGRVLLFSTGLSVCTALVFGLAPALTASRLAIGDVLKRGGSRGTSPTHRLQHALIVIEVGMATTLLAGSVLLIRSYVNLQRVERGFLTSTLTMRLSVDARRYTQPEQPRDFYRTLLSKVRTLPGVLAAGATSALPLSHSESLSFFLVKGYPNRDGQIVNSRVATGQYFDAMGTPLLAGRSFTDDDVASRPLVVVVNEAFAKTYLPGQIAIGQQYRLRDPAEAVDRKIPWSTIVGIVADVRHSNLEDPPPPQVYSSYWQGQGADTSLYITVRTAMAPADVTSAIRKTAYGIDPLVAVADIHLMDDRVAEATARRRFQTSLLTGFAVVAVGLAAIGLYGMLAYRVKQRTTEIGIRLALGAQARDVRRLIVGEALTLMSLGIVGGVAGAMGLSQLLRGLLYGVTRTDPVGLAAVLLVLLGTTLLASSIPARRASRVDPIIALRAE